MWSQIFVLCLSATPIFGESAENPWDELRQVFYTRHFSTGEIYEHDVSLDGPPFRTWARFYNDEPFHASVIAKLDAFLAQPAELVEQQPPVRRAILLRDLWPVFEAQMNPRLANGKDGVKPDDAAGRQTAIRDSLAKVMRRLELSAYEAKQLPDNYQATLEAKTFATGPNAESPEAGFLPRDLFAENGPWVPIARGKRSLGGLHHALTANYRSIFVPYIRVSDDRAETLKYLEQFRKARLAPPQSTLLALVRRTALPTSGGEVVATPIVESLQWSVVDAPRDRRYKFVLDRAEAVAGRPSLRMLTKADTIDAYSLESGGMFTHDPHQYDTDGEMLVFGRRVGHPKTSSLEHCTACHSSTVGTRLFANTGDDATPLPTTWTDQTDEILSLKQKSPVWQLYLKLRK